MRRGALAAGLVLAAIVSAIAHGGGDWPLHNLDLANSRFSPLTEINTTNASRLAIKWQADLPQGTVLGSSTPIVVGGIMYVNAGHTLFAVDGATGKMLWTRAAATEFPFGGRGPAFGDGRVYAVGRSMIAAFDARSGAPIESFGTHGVLNVARASLDFKDPGKYPPEFNPESIGYRISSAPTYANGTLIVGLAMADSLIPGGLVTAFDGATGRVKWVFRTVPQGPQDDGWELTKHTWSGPRRQGGGIWTQPAVDPALDTVYVNVSNPSPNYDGSSRKGTNLFTNSLVALNATTGRLKWHFQALHHDIWDWDLVTGPTLFDTIVHGKPVKAVASLAKTCYVFAFDRETGTPLFPIVETPVPTTTDMPGDEPSPTQPIPFTARSVPQSPFCATYPPKITDPELAARVRPMFTPYRIDDFIVESPGLFGGPNLGSSSYSPHTGLLYVTGKNDAWSVKLKSVGGSLEPSAVSVSHRGVIEAQGQTGVTATQNIAAFDPATGDLAWVAEFPGVTNGGTLVTAGDVVFEAIGRELHALDATNGKPLARVGLTSAAFATPLTYQAGRTQFIAIVAGTSIVAFGLP
jgi:glucose dehydrogenase